MKSCRKEQLFVRPFLDYFWWRRLFEGDFRKFSLNYYIHQNL